MSAPVVSAPTVHHLGYGQEKIEEMRSGVFAVLVGLTTGILTHYVSDLYHDAMWLERQLTKPMDFCYSVNRSGTLIGTSDDALYREHRFRCTVAVDERQRWTMTVTPV